MEGDFDGVPICGMMLQSITAYAKWPGPNPNLPWHLDTAGYRGGLSPEAVVAAYDRAWRMWADAIEIEPRFVQAAADALIRAHFAREDGASGVLAWSYLADNTNRPKAQRYDNSESWVLVNPGVPASGIDFTRVAAHEIGHVLGLDHDGANAEALMRPSYSTRIPAPTERDVQRVVGLGYARRVKPPEIPGLPPVGGNVVPLPDGQRVQINYAAKSVSVPSGWVAVQGVVQPTDFSRSVA